MNPKHQRGVALVITLIMVSIITLLAVSFLALSRRDRAAISVSQSDTVSRLAAQAAEAHAQAEIMARIIASSNNFGAYPSYIGYSNSFDRAGGVLVSTNVDIAGLPGNRLTLQQYVRNTSLLRQNPRVPVFIKRPAAVGGFTLDERFYMDFNRNGLYDSAGWNAINGNYYAGDPEWIGVLEHPNAPHSATNRFAFRYAYLVLPVGNSLDLNYVHNYARGTLGDSMARDRFSRNQGVGPWEINLAAFLQDLAPDFYTPASYSYTNSGLIGGATTSPGGAFSDAVGLLKYRYGGAFNLQSVSFWYGNGVATAFKTDFIDSYSLWPVMTPPFRNVIDPDVNSVNTTPWAGLASPNRFVDMQEMFKAGEAPVNLTNVLFAAGRRNLVPEDRYLFYRLLSQLSTGSEPELKGKINLNYSNNPALNISQTSFLLWQPTNFFKLAAQSILQANLITNFIYPGNQIVTNYFLGSALTINGNIVVTNYGVLVATNFAVTNIEIYPNNQYTPLVHQLLQEAANLYDSTSQRFIPGGGGVDYPTVFRPILTTYKGRIFICDWVEVGSNPGDNNIVFSLTRTNATFYTPDPNSLPGGTLTSHPFVYGLPWVIGAKKGFPNLNELNIATTIYAERKLQLTRKTPGNGPLTTNQMLLLSITNNYGIEAWNSYSNIYPNNANPRGLTLTVVMDSSSVMTNNLGKQVWPASGVFRSTFGVTTNITSWPGTASGARAFILPLLANVTLLPTSVYTPSKNPPFSPYNNFDTFDLSVRDGFPNMQLYFVMTNNFRYALQDTATGRLIDFVTFTNLSASIDIAAALAGTVNSPLPGETGTASVDGAYWLTNRVGSSIQSPTVGILNQMAASTGSKNPLGNADPNWPSEIAGFETFLNGNDTINIAKAAPYAPYRTVVNVLNFEVNDPLVHYMLADLRDPGIANTLHEVSSTTANLPTTSYDTMGKVNKHYSPWGYPGNPTAAIRTNTTLIDPGLWSSDAWDFPTNKFPSLGWIGRVHRGTPWQTIYLKSGVAPATLWTNWAGNLFTYPTNDWRLADLFTTALNDNAATGLLPVNQAGLPAWSAVLSGVVVLTNTPAGLQALIVQPASVSNPNNLTNSPVAQIVASINAARGAQFGGTFQSVGQILSAPALTDASPFIDHVNALSSFTSNPITDEAYERIPRQILSLVRLGQPRFVVYSYGQALKPADGSFVLDATLMSRVPGAFNICTNYQITGEAAYRTVFRLEGNPTHPNVVIESYTPLPPE